ncbi:hypothetical protein SCLCIDRAFT_253349 [Scleroderma citrinum Foug A]|uniref:Protein argonaute N-terminal domain-containing protein n=1 Tax=Scleroderma citrinum Foug A TaxID=1036808 RepID=A0A0C3AP85_9AGAM|nr:hypothetical protein SCLCIDRAFT_253349 [Scleroderma citrinum Foug A]
MSNRGGFRGGRGLGGSRGGPPGGGFNRGGPPGGGFNRGGPRGGDGNRGSFRGGVPTGAAASGDGRIFGSPAPVDQRLQTSDELVRVLKKLPYKPERPHRPGFGTLGTPITLRANFFPVKFSKQILYDYAVEITPQKLVNRRRNRLFALLEDSNHPQWCDFARFIVHDKNARLVSAKKLPESLEVPVVFVEEDETEPHAHRDTYTFTFELKHELDTGELVKWVIRLVCLLCITFMTSDSSMVKRHTGSTTSHWCSAHTIWFCRLTPRTAGFVLVAVERVVAEAAISSLPKRERISPFLSEWKPGKAFSCQLVPSTSS